LTQAEAALLLGQCERSFRRHIERYQGDGLVGLLDKRLSQISKRRASGAEVDRVVQLYKSGFAGWNVAHFHSKYRKEFKGERSYSWLKTVLQGAGVVKSSKRRGKHRIKRARAPLPGMLMHQDASTHRWGADQVWDLVVTMDDATCEHTSMLFRGQESTASSFHGIGQTIARYGLFASLYTDRCSHYFHTPEAGGQVDKLNLTEVGRALRQVGIEHIAAYSPEARGRSNGAGVSDPSRAAASGTGPRRHQGHGQCQPISGEGLSPRPQPGVRCGQHFARHCICAVHQRQLA
jgi:hypothetical protein